MMNALLQTLEVWKYLIHEPVVVELLLSIYKPQVMTHGGEHPLPNVISVGVLSVKYMLCGLKSPWVLRSLEQDNVKAFMFENSRSIASTGPPSNDKNTSTLWLLQY